MSNGFRVAAGACPVCGAREVECDAVEHGGKSRAASGTRAETSGKSRAASGTRAETSSKSRAASGTRAETSGKSRAASGTRAETSSWLLLAECPRCDHRWTQALREEPVLA